MQFTLTFSMDNDAFKDDPYLEVSRILFKAQDTLKYYQLISNTNFSIRDVNGNTIGYISIE